MTTESDPCVQTLVAFADAILNDKSQLIIADLCKFPCSYFAGKKKYHLLRETAFLCLFIIHAVGQAKDLPSDKINLAFNHIYRLKFQGKEKVQTWFSDLVQKIDQYVASASSEKAGGFFGIAGLFLISVKSFDNTLPGFEQFAVVEYIGKLFDVLIQAVEKYGDE
jgi:hypothetical protein